MAIPAPALTCFSFLDAGEGDRDSLELWPESMPLLFLALPLEGC